MIPVYVSEYLIDARADRVITDIDEDRELIAPWDEAGDGALVLTIQEAQR